MAKNCSSFRLHSRVFGLLLCDHHPCRLLGTVGRVQKLFDARGAAQLEWRTLKCQHSLKDSRFCKPTVLIR